jgi:hypothetical protein
MLAVSEGDERGGTALHQAGHSFGASLGESTTYSPPWLPICPSIGLSRVSECRTCSTPRLFWSLPFFGVPLLAGRRPPGRDTRSSSAVQVFSRDFSSRQLLQRCSHTALLQALLQAIHRSCSRQSSPSTRPQDPRRPPTEGFHTATVQLPWPSRPHLPVHLPFPSLLIPHRRCLFSPYTLTLLSFLTTHHLFSSVPVIAFTLSGSRPRSFNPNLANSCVSTPPLRSLPLQNNRTKRDILCRL